MGSMKLTKNARADLPPFPLFVPKFYLLIWKTLQIKWRNRHHAEERYTDHLAEFYTRTENNYLEVYSDAFHEIRGLITHAAGAKAHEQVLDLATGAGYQAAGFARHGCRVFASDYVHDRVALARELHSQQQYHWHVADTANLPFARDSFDIVTISLALHDMPYQACLKTLAELRRIARRCVVILEPTAPQHRILRWIYTVVFSLFDESLYAKDFLTSDLEASLAQVGLKVVQKRRCYHQILVMYVCEPQPERLEQSLVDAE